MKTEVCEKKKILNFHKKSYRLKKKKIGQKKFQTFFFIKWIKKFRKRLNNEKIC